MIRICVNKENDFFKKITFCGHANYADYGSDIVCASVSSVMLCTVNAIYSINDKCIKVIEGNDFVIEVLFNDEIVIKLIDNMIRCLESLERQYPKNIKISKEEE